MNDLERVKEKAREVKLSLEALSIAKRDKPPLPRSIPELLAAWRDKPPSPSAELRAQNAQRNMGDA